MSTKRNMLVVAALAAMMSMTACTPGNTDPTPATTGDPTSSATTDAPKVEAVSLELGMAAPSAGQPCVFYALPKGIFEDLGLDLTISPQGSNEPAMAAAGQLVIGANTISQAFPALQQGRDVIHVFAQTNGNPSNAITVKADSPYQEVLDLSGKTVGIMGASGYNRLGAAHYSNYIVENGGEPLNVVVQPDLGTLTAQLVNGQIDAAVFPPVFGAQIAEGILRQLISTKDPLPVSLNGEGLVNSTFWGLRSTIEENHDAIVRLVAGCRIAVAQMLEMDERAIAEVIAQNPEFNESVIPLENLAIEIEQSYIDFEPENQGYISEEQWDVSLGNYIKLGITATDKPYDAADPNMAYSKTVDMSYWEEATPLVEDYLASHS